MTESAEDDKQRLQLVFTESTLAPLQNLDVSECHLEGKPACLSLPTNLTIVSICNCSFELGPEVWLSAAVDGATHLKNLTFTHALETLPVNVCRLSNLQRLDLQGNRLRDLPPEIVQLVSLDSLILYDNQFQDIPEALQHMTHLKYIDCRCLTMRQLTRPLTFLTSFTNLENLSLREPAECWNSASMFRIGQLQVLFDEAFMDRQPSERPTVDFRSNLCIR